MPDYLNILRNKATRPKYCDYRENPGGPKTCFTIADGLCETHAFANPCHAPDSGRFCETDGGEENEIAVPENELKALSEVPEEAHDEFLEILADRRKAEPKYTQALTEAATGAGGEPIGLDFKFKTAEGIAEKITRKMSEKGISAEKAADGISDALRYTIGLPPDRYVEGIEASVKTLEAQGAVFKQLENNWQRGDAYNGVNAVFEDPKTGLSIELQFHTPESWNIKDKIIHKDYELVRERKGTSAQLLAAFDRMRQISDSATFPPGIKGLCSRLPSICTDVYRPSRDTLFASGEKSEKNKISVSTIEEMLLLLKNNTASQDDWEEFVDGYLGYGPPFQGWIYPNKRELTASAENTQPIAAGIAVLAEDTGRVLLLQRALSEDDPAAGKWEFPGGTLDPGESPIQAAVREFQEETGLKLPEGEWTGQHLSSNGVYKLFIWSIPTEDTLTLNPDHEDRKVLNPDDPDGDNIEVIAWWALADLVDNPAVRDELRDSMDWKIFQTNTPNISEPDSDFSYVDYLRDQRIEFYNKCHDEESGKFCEDPVTKKQVKIEIASKEERQAAKVKAKAWVRIAKVPSAADVAKGRENLKKAKQGESHRTTTEDRGGSAEARRKQRENLFAEFGGEKRGFVVDARSGIKMHYTDDPVLNPNQYPMFTRGRIFTARQGGGYTLDNILPESFESNRSRGSRPIRKENLT